MAPMLRRFTGLLILLALVPGGGCDSSKEGTSSAAGDRGGGEPGEKASRVIGLSVQTLTNPFFKLIADTVAAEAARHGFEVLVRDPEGKIANQKDDVKEFLVKGVDAIILCPRNTKAIGSVIIEANRAGVPVFTIDTICEDPQARVVHHVGTDNFQGGRVAGQAMIDALGEAGGKVAILEFKRVESCIDRVRGFEERIGEHNASAANKIELVAKLECGGAKEEGQNAARDAVNAHPDLRGIFAINDPAALGARAALEAEGKSDQVVVVGFDGQPEAKVAIKDGRLFDSPVQFPDRMAIESVKAVVSYFDGEEVEPVMLIPTEPYRRADADKDPDLE